MTSRSLDSTLSSTSINGDGFPEAKSPYNHFTHGLRKLVPAELACKAGCGGPKCKYCNSDWPPEKMAIPGLFSHWITEDILAMARPRTDLIENHNLIHHFKKAEIRSIFNLQSRNEHKDCGMGIDKESGYSYNPIDFTSTGIYYYNYELEDFSTGSLRCTLDMVKVLCFALQEGKAAIHCHAGLGRTGFFIACYLLYSRRISANEAIFLIREKRPNSVQMLGQIEAIKEFEAYLKPLRIVYSENFFSQNNSSGLHDSVFDLRTFLTRQRLLLHGYESKKLKYIPKIIFICGEQIRKLIIQWNADGIDNNRSRNRKNYSDEFSDAFLDYEKRDRFKDPDNENNPNVLIASALVSKDYSKKIIRKIEYYQQEINEHNNGADELSNETEPRVLAYLIWSWLDHLKEPVLNEQEINILLKNFPYEEMSSKTHLKELSNAPLNWKELDNGTLYTINYLSGLLHDLLPIPGYLEDCLIDRLICSLTQSELDAPDDTTISMKKAMKKSQYKIIHQILKDIIRNPVALSNRRLGKFNFKKSSNNNNRNYDKKFTEPYEAFDIDDPALTQNQPRSRFRSNGYDKKFSESYESYDIDDPVLSPRQQKNRLYKSNDYEKKTNEPSELCDVNDSVLSPRQSRSRFRRSYD